MVCKPEVANASFFSAQVDPTEAVALTTQVTVECSGFSPGAEEDDFDYVFSFATDATGEKSFYLGQALGGDDASLATVLPAGVVDVSVKVCNGYSACVDAKAGDQVTVTLQDGLNNTDMA